MGVQLLKRRWEAGKGLQSCQYLPMREIQPSVRGETVISEKRQGEGANRIGWGARMRKS